MTYIADVRTIRNVGQFVSGQMVFALQSGIADVAHEPSLHGMRDDVLFDQGPVGIRHLAFGTTEERGSVQSLRLPDLTGFRSGLLFLFNQK